MTHFTDTLAAAVQRLANPVCVGLDPRWEQLPDAIRAGGDGSLAAKARAYEAFCRGVVDVVAPLVPVVKLQAAFFEELGPAGMTAMAAVIDYAQQAGLLVILDGKRGDIGSTAEAYARGYLGRRANPPGTNPPLAPPYEGGGSASAWHADALTVNPYLGDDALAPFVDVAHQRGAGVFVLVKTSNPGSGMLQDIVVERQPLFRRVAAHVEELATKSVGTCGYGLIGAVVGATYPAQLAELRGAMPHAWLLVPGYGSQGGTAADVAAAFDANGLGAIVNNSRAIIFAHSRPEYADRFDTARWQEAVAAATREMIAELRATLPTLRS